MNTPEYPALSIPEFAAAYGLKESWVREQVRSGVLRKLHHRMGKHVRFTESDCCGFEALTLPKGTTPDSPAIQEPSPQDMQKAAVRLAKAQAQQGARAAA